jgi:hypothetical protein
MLKRKPIIISAGCSFTNPNFWSPCDHLPDEKRGGWPIWTDHFKDKLEKHHGKKYNIIHTGVSGGTQDLALDNIIKQIATHQDKIEYVLWGGTDFARWLDMFSFQRINPMWKLRQTGRIKKGDKLNIDPLNYLDLYFELGNALILRWLTNKNGRTNLLSTQQRRLWTVFKLCEQYNITLLYYQLLEPLYGLNYVKNEFERVIGSVDGNDHKLSIDFSADQDWERLAFTKLPWFSELLKYKEHFYGLSYFDPDVMYWSGDIRMNNNTDWHVENKKTGFDLIVCPPPREPTDPYGFNRTRDKNGDVINVDFHPNAQGHKDIADKLWKHYAANFI